MFDEIKNAFFATNSIESTVELTGFNEYKVRRALITMGLWESERSREVRALLDKGLNKEEIAERLHLSIKGLESYMPYTRGAYFEKVTDDTRDSKSYRKRMKVAKDRQVNKSNNIQERRDFEMEQKMTKVYKLRLELLADDEELEVLRELGHVREKLSRTIVVPSTMQLNQLNYAIQKCFGWENSHLHHFVLSDAKFEEIIKGDLDEWKKLAGVWFRCYDALGDNEDLYYLDDYDGRYSFRTWLKRKYSRKGVYDPASERYDVVQDFAKDVELRKDTFRKNSTKMDDLRCTLLELGGEELLERLEIKDVLNLDEAFYYEYDYGDGWKVKIDFIEEMDGVDSPICVDADGYNVLDDVGGVWGFCEFLKGLKGLENGHDYAPDSIEWAKDLGWRKVMRKAEKIL